MHLASIQVEIREPSPTAVPSASANPAQPSSQAILDFVASDETLDRYGDVICASGWRLESYRRNPVFQNAHQYGDILFTLGKALITEIRPVVSVGRAVPSAPSGQALFQRIQFATDINPIARIAYGLYKGKFLNAVSVGFIPIRWEDNPSPKSMPGGSLHEAGSDGAEPRTARLRRRYLEQELLEVSAVGIPANPNALALGLKSGAVSKSDLAEALDLLRSLSISDRSVHDQVLITFARELHGLLCRA